jgi:hypothetical protein
MFKVKKLALLLILFICIFSCEFKQDASNKIELFPINSGGKYGFIDKDGKFIINPQFSEVSIFRNGLSLVKTLGDNPKWGYINAEGKFIIAPNYKSASIFSDDIAWVVNDNSEPQAIDKNGQILFTLQNAEVVKIFKDGLAAFSVVDSAGTKWGFVNKKGEIIINPQFINTHSFSNGLCAVQNSDGKWGFINEEGKIVINYQFDQVKDFTKTNAIVKLGSKAGLINSKGKFIINPQFSDMNYDNENRLLIEQDGRWGWCDYNGKIIINQQFEVALPFIDNELAPVLSGKNWGYVDLDGKLVINPQFDWAAPYNNQIAPVLSSKKLGFIDNKGKYIINPQFDDVCSDFWHFLIENNSIYESVQTDYFNITSIVNRINLKKPFGINIEDKLSLVLNKYNLTENNFSQYATEHLVFNNQIINNDASMSFYINLDAYVDVPDGWYTQKKFNPNALIQGFTIIINLYNKAYSKEGVLVKEIEKSLTGFSMDSELSSDQLHVFKNDKQSISIYFLSDRITINIFKLQPNIIPATDFTPPRVDF